MEVVWCIECEDTQANVWCLECKDNYCDLCFHAQHKKGSRKKHATKRVAPSEKENCINSIHKDETQLDKMDDAHDEGLRPPPSPNKVILPDASLKEEHSSFMASSTENTSLSESERKIIAKLTEKAKYIPMRLTMEERNVFSLLDAALSVSEYTDKVDVLSYRSSLTKRILTELKEMFGILSGMKVASDFRKGKKLVFEKQFHENSDFFQDLFEIGRRYKIMNPERMRNNYGKMIYLLQDSSLPEVAEHLNFSCVRPIRTVHSFLKNADALELLNDEQILIATSPVLASSTKSLEETRSCKENAIQSICTKYATATLSEEVIRCCLSSIDDNNSYLALNCGPINRMIELLETHFSPSKPSDPKFSLAIQAGRNGARLTHNHETQFHYALQSMLLWRNITKYMLRIWFAIEDDLLGGSSYRLRDTGQGMNRVQRAPKTSRVIHQILSGTQEECKGRWVGSSVVHLGDHNVPNALMFIDKYTQVSRILNPIVRVIEEVDLLSTNDQILGYIKKAFGDAATLKKTILCDFFQHGFDGSGADNFFDAGSCIDGRLTSAWNWCSKIEKKPYYRIFLLGGFVGFDGNFEK